VDNKKRSPQTLAFLICGALGLAILPSLSGCVVGETSVSQLFDDLTDNYQISQETEKELDRFRAIYSKYVKPAELSTAEGLRNFEDAFKRVRVNYVRDVPDTQLINTALEGVEKLKLEPGSGSASELVEAALDSMMASLDPHSGFLNGTEYKEMKSSTRGEFGGLGIQVSLENGIIKVVSPIEDTPAFRAGLKPNDLITRLNGESIKDRPIMYSVRRMRGAPGSNITLTIERKGQGPFDVILTRAIIQVKAVRWQVEGNIGYIKVNNFSERVEDGLHRAIAGIQQKLGKDPAGIVLDLRNNPGGLLNQSVFLSDAFLEKGRIVSVKGRGERGKRVFDAESGDIAHGAPMVVLINGGSASASEIVAAALRDHGRATVMGSRSFGKGSVQTVTALRVEGALRLTTSLYYAPSGQTIQARGIKPDVAIVPGEESKRPREADLPGALAGDHTVGKGTQASIKETACPEIGDKKDRGLGCALALLSAGSTAHFLASLNFDMRM
jgi:carboxyl-terminal processing protease